jgi:hypothetical protein
MKFAFFAEISREINQAEPEIKGGPENDRFNR